MQLGRLFLAAALVGLPACGDGATGTGAAPCDGQGANVVVSATDNLRFSAQNITISAGQKVCWQNRGAVFHTVTSDDGSSFNGNLAAGAFFVHTFPSAGSFPYHCIPHLNQGMVGTVTVQ